MANTYTQIHLHIIFAVQNRLSLINNSWKDRMYQYITGIVQQNKHKMIISNGMPDHLHIAIGMRPTQSLSDLVQDIKGSSSKWINENKFVAGKFQLPKLVDYIKNQEAHHKKKTFIEEYKAFLNAFEVDYDDKYIFKELAE